MSDSNELRPIALLHEADSYIIHVEALLPKVLRISKIIRYPDNINGNGILESFTDLDFATRHAIVRQIQRRHYGHTVIS